ncbi:MAG TPA: hypothetical protein VF190_08410 [Rhodothermales bacterium]
MRDEVVTAVETALRRPVRLAHGWLGLALIAVAWPLNWLLAGPRTHLLFFPLWLGYVLVVDALVLRRTGRSMATSEPRRFAALFVVSIPLWWIFELLNERTRNWQYLGAELFSDLEYALLASVAFSTVIPAVLETAELVSSFRWMKRVSDGPRLPGEGAFEFVLFGAGLGMLGLVVARPEAFYPFLWGALYAIVEPINVRLGRPNLLSGLHRGDWRPLVALSVGALICGFFWEMWNYFSYPKWVYRTPGVEFLHVFEMPLLGYIGYLPFAWEVYAFVHLVMPSPPRLRLDASHVTAV